MTDTPSTSSSSSDFTSSASSPPSSSPSSSTEQPDAWLNYLQVTAAADPHSTLLKSLENFEREGIFSGNAIDLGCGQGRDTRELLRRNWNVLAIDSSETALASLKDVVTPEERARLQTFRAEFEGLQLPDADLINASLSIPFCHADMFPALWRQVVTHLRSGGRFAGHFFGPNDEWVSRGNWTYFSKQRLRNVLYGFQLEFFVEDERNFPTATGEDKHWHLFHVVAKKI